MTRFRIYSDETAWMWSKKMGSEREREVQVPEQPARNHELRQYTEEEAGFGGKKSQVKGRSSCVNQAEVDSENLGAHLVLCSLHKASITEKCFISVSKPERK